MVLLNKKKKLKECRDYVILNIDDFIKREGAHDDVERKTNTVAFQKVDKSSC